MDPHDTLSDNETRLPIPPDKVTSLLRRFNGSVNHLERTDDLPEHRFDFQAHGQSFSASRLRSNVQRCFLALVQVRDAARALGRLRSWEDQTRTGTAAAVYFGAWLSPLGSFQFILIVLIALILSPSFRTLLFPPPLPSALPSSSPSSFNSVPDEQTLAERQEDIIAQDFTEGLSELALMSAGGMATPALSEDLDHEPHWPSVHAAAAAAATSGMASGGSMGGSAEEDDSDATFDDDDSFEEVNASSSTVDGFPGLTPVASGGSGDSTVEPERRRKRDKFRKKAHLSADGSSKSTKPRRPPPRLERIGLPIQRATGKVADFVERIENALEPPLPFPETAGRKALARHLGIVLAIRMLLGARAFNSALGFLVGLLFFGGPLFKVVAEILDERVKGWRLRWKNRRTMFDPAPTDLQVTIRLMRDAEAIGQPLRPPPPLPRKTNSIMPQPTPANLSAGPSASTSSQKDVPIVEGSTLVDHSPGPTTPTSLRSRMGFSSSRSSLVEDFSEQLRLPNEKSQGAFKQGWDKMSKKATDKVRMATAKIDLSERLKQREIAKEESSKCNFLAHRGGVPGHLVLSPSSSDTPSPACWSITFVRIATATTPGLSGTPHSSRLLSNLTIPLSSITKVQKVTSGMTWRGKVAYDLLVGSSNGQGSRGGIKLSWNKPNGGEKTEVFGGVKRRDELFNRLAGLLPGKFNSI